MELTIDALRARFAELNRQKHDFLGKAVQAEGAMAELANLIEALEAQEPVAGGPPPDAEAPEDDPL